MAKLKMVLLLAAALLIAGCATQPTPTNVSAPEVTESSNPVTLDPAASEEAAPGEAAAEETPSEEEATECPGDEINPIGESIAADYDFASYDQVMAWFCEGAEFEDILVALETEDSTGEPADDMLQMLADGLTWDDIWLLVGLSN